jgi:hypothetical protein
MPKRRGSGTSGRDRAGGAATGAIADGDRGEAFGRLRGWKIASGGLVASTSTGAAGIGRRSACGDDGAPE